MHILDTNICIYLIKKKSEDLLQRIEKEKIYSIGISAITVSELEFGIAKSKYPARNRLILIDFLSSFEIIPYTDFDAEAFGMIKVYLNKMGKPIGAYDLQIAAQCLARNFVLITNNVKEFERVPDLNIDNWYKPHNCT